MKLVNLLIITVFLSGCFVYVDHDNDVKSFGMSSKEAGEMVDQINKKSDDEKKQILPVTVRDAQ